MQEQDLFNNYEIRNWDFSPRFYKILAASAVFNILALLAVGQSNLLTKKGCDSPLVGKVCTVIDAVYVGGTVLTTETGYVDEAYTPTELTSDDEITFINVADRLTYPEGYFALANPELAAMQNDPNNPAGFDPTVISPGNPTTGSIPGIPNNPTLGNPTVRNPLDRPQVLPKRKGKVVDDLTGLDPLGGVNDNPTVDPKVKPTRPRVSTTPKVDPNNPTVGQNDGQKNLDSKNADAIEINRRPLYDLKAMVKDKRAKGELNLAAPFIVQAKGKLKDDGKLDEKTFKFVKSEGSDPNLVELVKSSVAAISDAGFLQYLKIISGKTIDLRFAQDGTVISAIVESEMESDLRASTVQFYIQQAINASRSGKEKAIAEMQNNPEKAADLLDEIDDLELIKNAKVSVNGKKVVIEFSVPQEVASKMIERKLNEPDAPEKKPNSSAQVFSHSTNSAE